MKTNLAHKLEQVEKLSQATKLSRLLHHPIKYVYAIALKNILYPIFRKEVSVQSTLFTGKRITMLLPAATDIYLTGGKSHHSEIRLAKFLINNLHDGDSFWDIGAHYGYFTMLASELVGVDGSVHSFEASPTTYNVLKHNAKQFKNITTYHNAIADSHKTITFFELPNKYSEYNTTDITQFEKENWFAKFKPTKVEVNAITLDEFLLHHKTMPSVIKIDVEGGEAAVIQGSATLLSQDTTKPIIVMEYLEPKRNNQPHQKAAATLIKSGYATYIIDNEGNLQPINDIDAHLSKYHLESDNIVFKKRNG